MRVLNSFQQFYNEYTNNTAFFINNVAYKYEVFYNAISSIRYAINETFRSGSKIIGLVTNDDLETYASIIALWLEGKAYVPLNPSFPLSRNKEIIDTAEIDYILDSEGINIFDNAVILKTKNLPERTLNLEPIKKDSSELAYLFFTSGTTGKPKGVPITRKNVDSFVEAFDAMGYYEIRSTDRFLQMFDMTFDLSVMSYIVPLIKGASIYTVPHDKIKYSYIYELFDTQKLTVALMVPSILNFLRPYFDEINIESMKYCLFCGEALFLDIVSEWSFCIPNAKIVNVYGPTEDTIFCTHYEYKRESLNKSHNGILCIGKAMEGNFNIIIDAENNELGPGLEGELCLSGTQLTPGYWKNKEKNLSTFINSSYQDEDMRFYKTGDLCKKDDDGDILYIGRLDFQTKVQGFRVELSEIEFHAKKYLVKLNAIAITFKLANSDVIGLVVEGESINSQPLIKYLQSKLPQYMVPSKVIYLQSFPLNTNGKFDRKKLAGLFV